MGLPIHTSQDLPPYDPIPPTSDQCNSSSNPYYNDRPDPLLAPWQRRWNVEWLNQAVIPFLKHGRLKCQASRNRLEDTTREALNEAEDAASGVIAEGIKAGFVSKENAMKPTRLRRIIRRCTWHQQLAVHEVKAFKKCWDEFRNKDKQWRVTAVMEEQGENPRWQAEMTFTIQPKQYAEMMREGQWFDFPSPENIKWLYVTGPNDAKRLRATNQRHWGPDPMLGAATVPFGVQNGRVVQHPESAILPPNFELFIEQRRCNHCGYAG
ncbi:hypothetical protein F4859DRAFT_512096 [Xylaria cf. heliscus]|nr:hypothetical protein F4859DRAFT_512096 [Xylaria cf. heliscus]